MAEHGQGRPALIYLELDLLLSPLLKLEEIPHTLPIHPTPGASLLTCKNHPQPQVVISPLAAVTANCPFVSSPQQKILGGSILSPLHWKEY